jgi:hypothetical protein
VLCFNCVVYICNMIYSLYRDHEWIWFHYNLHSFYYCSGKEEVHWNTHRRKSMKSGLSGQIMLWNFQITRSCWLGTNFVSKLWKIKLLVFIFGMIDQYIIYMCCILCCSLIYIDRSFCSWVLWSHIELIMNVFWCARNMDYIWT